MDDHNRRDEAALVVPAAAELPPILAGSDTPEVRRRVDSFIANLHEIFESWVRQTESPNTQDAKRTSWLQFCRFLEARLGTDALGGAPGHRTRCPPVPGPLG